MPLATIGGAMLSGTGLGLGFKVAEVVATPVLEAIRARLSTRSQNDGPAAWQRLADDVTQQDEVIPMKQTNPSEPRFEPGEVVRVKSLGDQPGRVVSIAKRPAKKRGFSALFGGGGATKYQVVTVSGAPVVAEEGQLRRFNPDALEDGGGEVPGRIEGDSVIVRLGTDELGEPVDVSMPFEALDELDDADAGDEADDQDHAGTSEGDETEEGDGAPASGVGKLVTVSSNPEGGSVLVGLLGVAIAWGLVERARAAHAARQGASAVQVAPVEPSPSPAVGPRVWGFR